jgi:Protein of unknown function (DUF3703)
MLLIGIRIKSARGIIGQLPRLVFGGVKSFVGTIPIGNTGGANVSALRTMEVPDDLARILRGPGLAGKTRTCVGDGTAWVAVHL